MEVRYGKVHHLWALAVGSVISGDFFGWQASLAGGFAGGCIALGLVSVMYALLTLCIAELAAHDPQAGGPYTFATSMLGEPLGFLAGLAESLNVLVTTAVITVGISTYMIELTGTDARWAPLWWAAFFVLFTVLNVLGVQLSFNLSFAVTIFSLLVLAVFYCGAIPRFDFNKWVLGSECKGGGNQTCEAERWVLPKGVSGVAEGLSFSLWFYLGIEELPMAIEETKDPEKTMPRAILLAMGTLILVSYLTLVMSSAIAPGARAISTDTSPLLTGYKTVFADASWLKYVSWVIVVGLIASLHSFIFCTGRLLYAIARDGLFPSALAMLHGKFKTPYVALITGSGLSFLATLVLYFVIGDNDHLGNVMINLALLGALVSYVLQCVSYIVLRWRGVNTNTYRSPAGVPGALVCILICLLTYGCIIREGVKSTDYLYSVLAAAALYALGMIYYFVTRKLCKRGGPPPVDDTDMTAVPAEPSTNGYDLKPPPPQ